MVQLDSIELLFEGYNSKYHNQRWFCRVSQTDGDMLNCTLFEFPRNFTKQ